jgi:predicted 3-demethylubiquinone-9 3-methyltransferase (glyoxalase superfamily)
MPTVITPFLWFDTEAEEAATLYTSVFPESKITKVQRYGAAGPGPEGTVMTVEFELRGQRFTALNGGKQPFSFNESVSFVVDCADQAEVDYYWDKLTADGGEPGPCGWLKDRYGLSWQVVPVRLMQLIADPDPGRAQRATEAMLKMSKIDVSAMEAAAASTS